MKLTNILLIVSSIFTVMALQGCSDSAGERKAVTTTARGNRGTQVVTTPDSGVTNPGTGTVGANPNDSVFGTNCYNNQVGKLILAPKEGQRQVEKFVSSFLNPQTDLGKVVDLNNPKTGIKFCGSIPFVDTDFNNGSEFPYNTTVDRDNSEFYFSIIDEYTGTPKPDGSGVIGEIAVDFNRKRGSLSYAGVWGNQIILGFEDKFGELWINATQTEWVYPAYNITYGSPMMGGLYNGNLQGIIYFKSKLNYDGSYGANTIEALGAFTIPACGLFECN